MKKALYILLFCTLMACGSNHQKQDTINTLGNFTEQTVEQQPTTVEGDCIMEDVLRLIPKDVLPENMRQLDLAAEILKKAEGGDDSYEVQCNYAYYDRTEGECDHSAIQLKSFPKADGSHLVLYAYSGGCDCNVMIDHKAYIYQEGQLSETSWPFPEPGFDEFYNTLSFYGADKADIDFTKEDGMPYYILSPDDNILCDWAACDYYDFLDYQRPITYHWNGESFDKNYGEYRICGESNFGGLKLGGPMPQTLDGFRLDPLEQNEYYGETMLVDTKTGENIAKIQYGIENGVQNITYIEVYSKHYATDNGTKVGDMIADVLKASSMSAAYNFSDGKAEDDTTRWTYVKTWHGIFAVDGNSITVGTPHTSPNGDLDPLLGTDLKASVPSEPVRAIEIMKVSEEE